MTNITVYDCDAESLEIWATIMDCSVADLVEEMICDYIEEHKALDVKGDKA